MTFQLTSKRDDMYFLILFSLTSLLALYPVLDELMVSYKDVLVFFVTLMSYC